MLKNTPKIVSPELLKVLCEMGHGDEIVIADGNFPSQNISKRVVRADGLGGAEILDAVTKLIPLDTYAEFNAMTMQLSECDKNLKTPILDEYAAILEKNDGHAKSGALERYAFYDRAREAYAVIATGEEAIYANIIIKKGVIK